ncbi:MAG: hypothetical protein KJP23_15055, partial [Deltaproteobacteria bacterium]|nr:hypothetical protein [Deltaproteobacteria bacterium]
MNVRTYLYAAAILSLIFTPRTAFADMVFLKNGKELKVEKAWQEGDQVWFIYQDMKASIPQSKVTRIESGSGDQKNSSVPGQQPNIPAKRFLVLHKEGLGDLKWGDRVADVADLEIKQTDSGLKEVLEYVRPQDALKLGDAKLTSVVYA